MRRPLVAVVVAYIIGLLLAQCFQPPLLVLAILSAASLGLLLYLPKYRRWLVWLLLIFLGWNNFLFRTEVRSPVDLRVMMGADPAIVTLRGQLTGSPRLKLTLRDDQEQWRTVADVRVTAIRRGDDFQPAVGEVVVTAPDVLSPEFFSDQPVEVTGVLGPPAPPLAEGLFDNPAYLAMRGIFYQVKTTSTNDWKLLAPHQSRPPLADRFLGWAHQTLALGLPEEDEPLRLLWAMTLGWRTAFTGDVDEPFLRAGTFHMFAIDGLRIALVTGMIVTLLSVLRVSRAVCGGLAIPVIWFYTAATGWEPSAVRASVMMTIVIGGWALKRPADLLNSLAAAALVILVLDPRQWLAAGFQLSFFVMLVIALLLPPLNAFSDGLAGRLLQADPWLPPELVPAWRHRCLTIARQLARYFNLSLAAWLGSLPLAAKYFHLFSPVSPLANLVAVPLGTGALMANLGALLCGHWLPWVTATFNFAAWACMVLMTFVSVEFARLPGAYWYVATPSLAGMSIYYAVLLLPLTGWFKTPRRRWLGLAGLLLLAAMSGWRWQAARNQLQFTVLPLGGGHAVYEAGGPHGGWLINCGSEEAVNYTLKEFLRAQGVNALPHLVLADASARNCGGTARLAELFPIGELWTAGVEARSPAYRQAVAAFDSKGQARVARHHVWTCGDTHDGWQVLFPAGGPAAKAGDAALVLRGDFPGARILLLSDLSRAGQSKLLAQTNNLRADIVIAGLPDGGEPLCDALIAAVRPQVMVIADAEFPASRRASRALHERLAQTRIPVVYTRTARAVKIVTDASGWSLETMDGQRFSGGFGGQ
jgi:competence protein ComEC